MNLIIHLSINQSINQSIKVWPRNRHSIPNTHHLYQHILRNLHPHSFHSSVGLWIDQICINQDDVHERNEQVALMHRIYSKAENVVIWLGEEGPDDRMAFGFVPKLLSYLPPLSAGHGATRQGLVARQALPLVGSPAWTALSGIFSRPYFRRSWII